MKQNIWIGWKYKSFFNPVINYFHSFEQFYKVYNGPYQTVRQLEERVEEVDDPFADLKTGSMIAVLLSNYKVYPVIGQVQQVTDCLLYTSPSPRDKRQSRMPSSA